MSPCPILINGRKCKLRCIPNHRFCCYHIPEHQHQLRDKHFINLLRREIRIGSNITEFLDKNDMWVNPKLIEFIKLNKDNEFFGQRIESRYNFLNRMRDDISLDDINCLYNCLENNEKKDDLIKGDEDSLNEINAASQNSNYIEIIQRTSFPQIVKMFLIEYNPYFSLINRVNKLHEGMLQIKNSSVCTRETLNNKYNIVIEEIKNYSPIKDEIAYLEDLIGHRGSFSYSMLISHQLAVKYKNISTNLVTYVISNHDNTILFITKLRHRKMQLELLYEENKFANINNMTYRELNEIHIKWTLERQISNIGETNRVVRNICTKCKTENKYYDSEHCYNCLDAPVEECCICFTDKKMKFLPCTHKFCYECSSKLTKCPLCRIDLPLIRPNKRPNSTIEVTRGPRTNSNYSYALNLTHVERMAELLSRLPNNQRSDEPIIFNVNARDNLIREGYNAMNSFHLNQERQIPVSVNGNGSFTPLRLESWGSRNNTQ